MAITAVDKIRINKYLKEHALGDLYYLDMCDALGKRGKISDVEFLEYFAEYVACEFRRDDKISVNRLTKVISIIDSFLGWAQEEKTEINEEILDKIRSFKEFYDEYLNRTGYEMDVEFNNNSVESIVALVNELYPREVNCESVSKYINSIAELEANVRSLEKELAEATRLYNNLQGDYVQKSSKVDELSEEVCSLRDDIKGKRKEIGELDGTIEALQEKIASLEGMLAEVKEENAELSPYKAQYEVLSTEVKRLRKIIDDDIRTKTASEKLKVKHSNIESLIYQKLLLERASIDDLVNFVKEHGLVSDNKEIAGLLRKMRGKINIDSSGFTVAPGYKIVAPTVCQNGKFSINVPFDCKHYDIMLVSDFHIKEMDTRTQRGYDILTDYCVKNGINLILNLGDFYNGFNSGILDYESAIKNYESVEQAIAKLPQVDGLYHAVLGGNHEKNMTRFGFDPIAMMAQEREDFIDLGYTHSTVLLNNPSNNLGCFDIHHPDTYDFPVDLDDDGIYIGEMDAYLSELYGKQGRNRDESYIDVFGHTHRNQFNYPSGYCYIPSYFEGGSKKGACHMRIYFDEDTDIKYMVFMPLSYSNGVKLNKTTEVLYQKVLTK